MLFWLAPNQQIRPPIYSLKQRSQRRKIVFKCMSYPISDFLNSADEIDSIVYFLVQGMFVALIVVPAIFSSVLNLTPKSAPFGGVI
jgi:1,3-beta-glucan synthase